MKNKQKGSVLVWIVIAIVIIAGVGAYLYSQNKVNQISDANTSNKVESNWKTYTDPKGNFSFRYPETWQTDPNPKSGADVRIIDYAQTDGPANSDKPRDVFEVQIVNSCQEQAWRDDTGGVPWGRACISNGHQMAQLTFIATSEKSQTLEENIESTFKLSK